MRYLGIKLSLLRWAGTPRITVSAFQDSTHRFATTRCLHQMRRCKWRQWKGESIFRDAFPDSTLLCAITRCLHQMKQFKWRQRKGESTFRSEEHTSELQSLMRISYAVFCLKTKHT